MRGRQQQTNSLILYHIKQITLGHIDQNEKLVMFGVTHICAVDGKIMSFITMPALKFMITFTGRVLLCNTFSCVFLC